MKRKTSLKVVEFMVMIELDRHPPHVLLLALLLLLLLLLLMPLVQIVTQVPMKQLLDDAHHECSQTRRQSRMNGLQELIDGNGIKAEVELRLRGMKEIGRRTMSAGERLIGRRRPNSVKIVHFLQVIGGKQNKRRQK